MVRLKTIKPDTVDLWRTIEESGEHQYVGTVNSSELAHARLQIRQQSLEGYFVFYKGVNYPIDNCGMFNEYPKGFEQEYISMIMELLK